MDVFRDNMWTDYEDWTAVMNSTFPEIMAQGTPIARAAEFYTQWVDYAHEHANHVFRLEDLDMDALVEAIGHGGLNVDFKGYLNDHDLSRTIKVD